MCCSEQDFTTEVERLHTKITAVQAPRLVPSGAGRQPFPFNACHAHELHALKRAKKRKPPPTASFQHPACAFSVVPQPFQELLLLPRVADQSDDACPLLPYVSALTLRPFFSHVPNTRRPCMRFPSVFAGNLRHTYSSA